jgi:CheY-like chemotaxis protein
MSARRSVRPWSLLLVQDDVEAAAAHRALRETALPHVLTVCGDADASLAALRRTDESSPEPDLVLLDMELARSDATQLLARIKGDPALRHVPVIALSSARTDVNACYRLHANCCLPRPAASDAYAALVRAVAAFWFGGAVMLPARALTRGER